VIVVASAFLFAGCGTSMPIQKTGNNNEYVLNRDDKSPLGSLADVKIAVSKEAKNFCAAMNGKMIEKYSIDKERAMMVWPESTLYFECNENIPHSEQKNDKSENFIGAMNNSGRNSDTLSAVEKSKKIYPELVKLDELRKSGIITEIEFNEQKKKLLDDN